MADINATQTAALRKDLQDRYGLSIDARITRVEFENGSKVRTYFRAEDGYKPPKAAEEPKTVYSLLIYETKSAQDPSEMQFGNLGAAMMAFRAMQHRDYAMLVLTENCKMIQKWENEQYGRI